MTHTPGTTDALPRGLAEGNYIEGSRLYGVSIGHHDTNNVIRDNEIRASGEVDILFRKEPGPSFQGNQNCLEKNRILGVAQEQGIGVDIQGQTKSITIRENEIRETQAAGKRVGIRIGPEADEITLADNRIEGFSQAVLDLRRKQ